MAFIDNELDYDFAKLHTVFSTYPIPNEPGTSSETIATTVTPAKPANFGSDWTGFIEKTSNNPIASGGCADIYMGRWTHFPGDAGVVPRVVIKDVKMLAQEYQDEKIRDKKSWRIRREVMVWQRVRHPNVLPFVGIVNFPRRLTSLVFLYMDQGDVQTYMRNNPTANRMDLVVGVTRGLHYLHEFNPPIIHGDMKAVNVLVDSRGHPRIADFGLSKLKGEITSLTTNTSKAPGTTRYMSPELFGIQLTVTLESDVWAWGMTALEILTGKAPFHALREHTVMWTIIGLQRVPDRPSAALIPDEVWAILLLCWDQNPLLRPTMSQVLDRIVDASKYATCDFTAPLERESAEEDEEWQEPQTDEWDIVSPPLSKTSSTMSYIEGISTNTSAPSRSVESSSKPFYDITGSFDWLAFRKALPHSPFIGEKQSYGLPNRLPNWTGYVKKDEYPFFGGDGIYVWNTTWVNIPIHIERSLGDGDEELGTPPYVVVKTWHRELGAEIQTTRRKRSRKRPATYITEERYPFGMRELKIWAQLRHKNILPLVGFLLEDAGVSGTNLLESVSPWMMNGDAAKYFAAHPYAPKRRFFLEIAHGLRYLHEFNPPIIHTLLRPANVLVDDMGSPKIIDFKRAIQADDRGMSGDIDEERGPTSFMWIAPEVLGGSGDITLSYDVYSYAMTCLSLTTGKFPFAFEDDMKSLLIRIVVGGSRPSNPFKSVAEDRAALEVARLWIDYVNLKPSERPDRRDIQRKADASWARQDAEVKLWDLWMDCWKRVGDGGDGERPEMSEMVRRMDEIVSLDPSA